MLNVDALGSAARSGWSACLLPRRADRLVGGAGDGAGPLALAVVLLVDFDGGRRACSRRSTRAGSPDLGVSYSLGIDGLSVFLVLLTAVLWLAGDRLRGAPRARSARTSSS